MTAAADRAPELGPITLNERRRDEIFEQQIRPERFADLESVSDPCVYFLGGQPGAGKTALQRQLEGPLGSSGFAEVGPDLFRAYHPRYHELVERDDQRTSFHTNADAGAWVQRAIQLTQSASSHVMLEGTLRNPDVTIATARGYGAHGFRTELHVPIVHKFVSRLYIIRRYLGQLEENGVGRFTIRAAHDSAYTKLPESLTAIEASGVMERIVLHVASDGRSHVFDRGVPDAAANLEAFLLAARHRPHLSADVIAAELDGLEPVAIRCDRNECLADIRTLRSEVASFTVG